MDAFRPQVSGTPEAMIRSFVFKNVGTSDIPGYGCMMLVSADGSVGKGIGAETESNRAVVYCKRPDSEAASRQDPNIMAFNSRSVVKPGKLGRCVIGGYPTKALGTSDDSSGGLRVAANSYSLESGEGAFVSVGTPDGESGLSYVMASRSSVKLVRFVLTQALQANNSAQATLVSSESSTGTGIVVSDWVGNSGDVGNRGIAWNDSGTYRVIEIKGGKSSELVRFTLDEDIDSTSHLAGATIVSSGEDDEETIEVTDWCRNGGKEGDNGIAWRVRNPETNEDEYYIVEIKRQDRVQFIQGTASSAGDFESATADSFTLQGVVGLDRAWEGGETITVHNPLEIKVWDSDCIVKCQWNQDEDRYEVVAATQKYVMHGVRIYKFSSTCRFEKLDSTGISNWNGETFPEVTTTSPNWVTEVYVAGTAPNQTLRYKTYCMDVSNTGVQIIALGTGCP
jgi:hypothetical protein